MKIDILTIFPDYFTSPLKCSLLGKAVEKGVLEIKVTNIRDFSPDGRVDDAPYGGGAGMVLMAEPVYKAVESVKTPLSEVVVFTPRGETLNQSIAKEFSKQNHLVLICGRYEGIDQRICEIFNAREISVGNYVLPGGEAAALVFIEAVCRLLPGFMGNSSSLKEESFEGDFLEYPHYTRPREFMGLEVPEVLLSGNHEEIKKFRESEKRKVRNEI